jgi:hypothetical protein
MLIQKLFDYFDCYSVLHIDVNDVRDQLVSMGVQDEIKFHFVKIDSSKIRGLLHRYTKHSAPYSEPILCSDIIISGQMAGEEEAWSRLVAVKELLHIADCANVTAQSEEAVNNLFEQFSLPPELRDSNSERKEVGASFLNDRVRIYCALAILIPKTCREALRLLYPHRLSEREIAEIAKVPLRYIPGVIDESFESLIETFLTWEKNVQPK